MRCTRLVIFITSDNVQGSSQTIASDQTSSRDTTEEEEATTPEDTLRQRICKGNLRVLLECG